jgi:hypothetical protein
VKRGKAAQGTKRAGRGGCIYGENMKLEGCNLNIFLHCTLGIETRKASFSCVARALDCRVERALVLDRYPQRGNAVRGAALPF